MDLNIKDSLKHRSYVVGGVLSESKELVKSIEQARDYAISKGINFCCVTNGHQFVFFRSQNGEGIEWLKHKVLIFRDFEDILNDFSTFHGLLAYEVVNNGILPQNMPVSNETNSDSKVFYRLETRSSILSRKKERNLLYPYLRQIVRRVFEEIRTEDPDSEILRNCYVETSRGSSYEKGLGTLLKDQQTILQNRTEQITVTKKKADSFQNSIEETINTNNPIPEVLLLLGGVGAGKTTFIHRFRKILAKDQIDENCLWAYVNFNLYSGTGENLLLWTAEQILASLEKEHPTIDFDSWEMLKQIYHKEFEKLRRGVLAPIWKTDKAKFEEKFSERVMTLYENTGEHVIRTLQTASKKYHRRPFLVFDNADQHDADIQNDVFLVSQKMAQTLNCTCLISLREESYWKNKDFGALSAFHSVSYHVQAPRLEQIIAKRFKYARKLIKAEHLLGQGANSHQLSSDELDNVIALLGKTILGEDKRFIEFAEYLCPGEVRRPLDFFAKFMYSGHTNVNSLLRAVRTQKDLVIGFHEYVTAIMLGDREYYSEKASDILNLFAVDGRGDASHFNRLTILGRILKDRDKMSEIGHGFIPIKSVVKDCEVLGLLPETTSALINLLIKRRLLQTETQIRETISESEFVRATSAALYYFERMVYESAYLESILFDTPIGSKVFFERLKKLTKHANDSEQTGKRLERLRFRLDRTGVFLDYLVDEYKASRVAIYGEELLDDIAIDLPQKIKVRFEDDKKLIFKKAKALLG